MSVISFTKVSAPYGWLGNMSPYPLVHDGKEWRTAEALFQALRLAPPNPVRELIREEKSPMGAKMVAKKHADQRVVTPLSADDLSIMRLVLRLKVNTYLSLRQELLDTGDALIVEDVTKRPGGSGTFWGAALQSDGTWAGDNHLGRLWMELREELRSQDEGSQEG